MKFFLLITAFIVISSGNGHAQAFPNPATLSTGQGVPGTLDPLWLVSPWYSTNPPNPMGQSYSPALINNNCAPGAWVNPAGLPPPVNNGNWITGSDAPCAANTNDGYRYFRLTIILPADCNGNSVTVAGNYTLYLSGYADNTISNVFINGNSTGISGGGFAAGTQLNMTLIGPWVVGVNYIDVSMYNFPGGGSNPYGLLLVANSTASSTADGDGDGISDLNDQCPCQPGSLANGCEASIVGDTVICKGESTTLTSTGIGTYLWSTGSTNSSITVNPIIPTSYYVKVKVLNGFEDSAFVNVNVNPTPVPSIVGDVIICSGETCSLTASGGGTYAWNTGATDASIVETPATTTNYKVVVTNSYGCGDSVSQSVTVFPKPYANFTFTDQCKGTAIPFNSISTISNPGIISGVFWDFGDSTSGFGSSAQHVYNSPGSYSVTIVVNSSNSCSDTMVQVITVFTNPIAGFTFNDVCLGDTVHFTNTSSASLPASISSYLWTFGDNAPTYNTTDPSHYYVNPSAYTVALIVTTGDACSDTVTAAVNVFDPPVSGFTFNNTCLTDPALFINTTIAPSAGTVASWSWDFGDGSALNTADNSPGHLFPVPGNYQVTLISYSSNLSCVDTLSDTISIFPMPAANFGFANVCLGQSMNFNDLSIVLNGSIGGRSWGFGDSSALSAIQDPIHTYTIPGTYFVSLIVTSANGCNDTTIKSAVVHPLPVVQFSSTNVCDGSNIQFTDLSGIATTDTIQARTWDFGDGSPFSSNQNASHLYAADGSYNVELLIISNFGCRDSVARISVVNPNPVVSFTATDTIGCEPLCLSFQDVSNIATGNNISWAWNLGDGSIVNSSQIFDHCYANGSGYLPDYFDITLTVTSDSGCFSTLSKNNYITVYHKPIAVFTTQPETTTVIDPVISITDLSIGSDLWNWNFGDGSASLITSLQTTSGVNPSPHTYVDTGSYTLTLITSTAYGCMDTAYQTITIEPDFVFYIPNAFSPDGDEINESFGGKGNFIKEFEMSIFDRWGNLIYKTEDINKPWDGKANRGNDLAQADTYVYVIKAIDFNHKKHGYKGVVTLVR